MAIKLDKKESVFRNELIFAADAKAINLDNTLTNLFMMLRFDGKRVKTGRGRDVKFYDLDILKKYLIALEETGDVSGFKDNLDAANDWLRSNLVNMVFRGNLPKERISSLRPIHLESYKIRNPRHSRDYNTADQVYLMLRKRPEILNELKSYLSKGWDIATKNITNNLQLDVDSAGILQLIKNIKAEHLESPNEINLIRPVLESQADLFCDDIHRLLVYREVIPRNVFIEYLRILIGFHLSLYTQKIIHLLPVMLREKTTKTEDDWSVIVDVTGNLDSEVARFACADMEKTINGLYDYFKATFQINALQMRLEFSGRTLENIDELLALYANPPENFDAFYEAKLSTIISNLEEEDKPSVIDNIQYEDTHFDKYVQVLLKARGAYQYKYYIQFLDNISMKNSEYGFLADGRSRKHPRRAVLGSKLLETLVQLLVLEPDSKSSNGFYARSLSIEELMERLKDRYGIIINGLNEERFSNADVQVHAAFKENVDAFKNKLRQIGFYTDLSDAYILQKIRPRYKFKD